MAMSRSVSWNFSGMRALVTGAGKGRSGDEASIGEPAMTASSTVKHDVGAMKFYIPLKTGNEAFLQYSLTAGGALDLYHTEVPPSHRGQGLGAVLAEAALSHARLQGSKVILTCTYLQHYLTKHLEHRDLVCQPSSQSCENN